MRCRLRPVKEAETEKTTKKKSLVKVREKNITIHWQSTVYGMNVMLLFFQRNTNENKSNGNCFYAAGKKRWMVNCYCPSQPSKASSPHTPRPISAPSDVPEYSHASM